MNLQQGAATDERVCWFRHAGIGFRAGASFRENALSDAFPADYLLGPELQVAVWSYSMHRAVVGAGYLYLNDRREKGTTQIRVETSFQRLDLFAGYGIAWKLLTAGLRVGTALTVINVKTTHGQPSWEVIGTEEDPELVIHDPVDPEVRDETRAGRVHGLRDDRVLADSTDSIAGKRVKTDR
jgi:hypothetical protein